MNDTLTTAEPRAKRAERAREAKVSPRLDIQSLHAELQQAVFIHSSESDVFAGLTDFLHRLLGAVAVVAFRQEATGTLTCVHPASVELGGPLPVEACLLEQWAAAACQEHRSQINRLEDGLAVVCMPVESDVQPTLALAVVFPPADEAIEHLVMISQLAASSLTCWRSSRLAADLEWETKTAAAVLDLVEKIQEVADLTSACHTLAAELQTCLGSSQKTENKAR